jgi:hypothetical protein
VTGPHAGGPHAGGPQPGDGRAGGVVVITSFTCHSLANMLVVWRLHHRLEPYVYRRAGEFLGVHLVRDWRNRRIHSITLWASLPGVYDMGEVPQHVAATRLTGPRGIQTSCGIFSYDGDWLQVMFGARHARPSPLTDWPDPQRQGRRAQKEKHHVRNSH